MSVKLLTEHHLEFLSLKGGCTGSSESTLVKMPHCWKSHVMAQLFVKLCNEHLCCRWSSLQFCSCAMNIYAVAGRLCNSAKSSKIS